MLTIDKTNLKGFKNTSDNPKRLAQYLLYGSEHKIQNEIQRVLYKGTFNSETADLEQVGTAIKLLNDRYNATASLRSKNRLRTHHIIISLNAGEHLTAEQWAEVAREHLHLLNLDDHLAMWAVHKDSDNEHMHLVFSDVNPRTLRINALSKSHAKWQKLDKELEVRFDLKADNHDRQNKLSGENLANDLEAKTGQQSLFSYIKSFIPELIKAQSWQEFHKICKLHNIDCVKLGRGIAFETDDPNDPNHKIYVKGSAFNQKDIKMSLSELEKRLGPYEKPDESVAETKNQETYEAKPVNFSETDNTELLNLGNSQSLQEAFDEYKTLQIEQQNKLNKLNEIEENLERKYKELLKKEKHLLKVRNKSIEKNFSNAPDSKEKLLKESYEKFDKHKKVLDDKYKEIKQQLKKEKVSNYPLTNFLDYLKFNIRIGIHYDRNLILLLSRKQSGKQHLKNNLSFPRIRVKMDQGITQNLMNIRKEKRQLSREEYQLNKVTGKGQLLYAGTGREIGDFIKDDGQKLMLNDSPSLKTVNVCLKLCKKQLQPHGKIKCHGTDFFQRQILELSLIKDLDLELENKELNDEYRKRKEARNAHREERRKLAELTKARRERQSATAYRKTRRSGKFISGRTRPLRRFQYLGDEFGTADTATNDKSTERNNISDTASVKNEQQSQMARENAQNRSSLHDMSKLHLAENQNGPSVLLSDDKRDRMGEQSQREILPRMRWSLDHEGREQREAGGIEHEDSYHEYKEVAEILNRFSETGNEKKNKTEKEIIKYIKERNEKHLKGFKDVLEHRLWTEDETGNFIYQGLRNLDQNFYALLKQDNIIFLKQVENYALERLKKTKRGQKIKIDKAGKIINNSRNHKYDKNTQNKKEHL